MLLGSAFILGLFGSLHCVGMCGPIALTVSGKSKLFQHRLLYNFGRAFTYSILGAAFGLLGMGLSLAGSQKFLSIGIGVLMILTAVFTLPYWKLRSSFFNNLVVRVKNSIGSYLRSGSFYAPFMIGMVNGLLPCGLVYIAIAGAVATGNPANGAMFMALFGLGTMPALIILVTSWSFLQKSRQINLRKMVPVFITLLGILFVLRGLELGIPYVSPILHSVGGVTECQ